jgi:uncharacterized protein
MLPLTRRRTPTLAAGLLLALGSQGCLTMRIPDDNWFHPGRAALSDSLVGAARLARGATLQRVWLRAGDSTRLFTLFVRTPGARTTVLYFGGDSFRVASGGLPLARAASLLGVNAVLVDYRGYGESDGVPSLPALQQDALDVFDQVRTMDGVTGTAIVAHGFSMGSFIAAHLATRRPVDGLVLESTATTVRDWAGGFVPWYARPFVRIRMSESLAAESNVERLQRYRGPLLLVVGARDRVTRPWMSRELFRRSATPERDRFLVVVPGAGHGDALNDPAAAARYGEFLHSIATASTFYWEYVG